MTDEASLPMPVDQCKYADLKHYPPLLNFTVACEMTLENVSVRVLRKAFNQDALFALAVVGSDLDQVFLFDEDAFRGHDPHI